MKLLSTTATTVALLLCVVEQCTAFGAAHDSQIIKRQAQSHTTRTASATTRRHSSGTASVVAPPTVTSARAATTTPRATASPTAPSTGRLPMSPLAGLSAIGTTTSAEVTQPLPTTFAAGATPPISGAPPLPAITALNPANYPALDRIPPTNSPEVRQWLSQIDFSRVPNTRPSGIDLCANATYNAEAIRNAGPSGDCWWSCGGCTAPTDITVCPNRNDWGVSFDDGPSPYTPRLLNVLAQQNIQSTFFVVGSRVLSRPEMVQTEYMMGHHISIHTWSHHALTTLTNEEIVAELGWTRKVIKDVIGVSPTTFRPPYGDVNNRVRAIAQQMGLTPIIWTAMPDGRNFDTEDWKIGAGTVSAAQVYRRFESFMDEAVQSLSTGFIVLAHDLYQQSVDLAVGYTLPSALNRGQLSLKPISTCQGLSLGQVYAETSNNATLSRPNDGAVRPSSAVVSASSASRPSSATTLAASASASVRPNSAVRFNPNALAVLAAGMLLAYNVLA